MKSLVILLAIAGIAYGKSFDIVDAGETTAYGYFQRYGIARAEQLQKAEEELASKDDGSRIVGGVPAGEGQYPWQVGLIINLIGITGQGVCGGSLIGVDRVATAAHCWFDGINQGSLFTVVLGSTRLFSGGQRQETNAVTTHPNWFPYLVRNDVAFARLPIAVAVSATIAPIALPSGAELIDDFSGESAIVSGYGLISDGAGISTNQYLSHVRVNIITNSVCALSFPFLIQDSNICTSGVGGVGPCNGDSGGPLVVERNGRKILVGVVSFGSALGCETLFSAAYARVTSYASFLNSN